MSGPSLHGDLPTADQLPQPRSRPRPAELIERATASPHLIVRLLARMAFAVDAGVQPRWRRVRHQLDQLRRLAQSRIGVRRSGSKRRRPSPGLATLVLSTSLVTVVVAAAIALGLVPGHGSGGPANAGAFAVSASGHGLYDHPTRGAPTHVVVVPPAPATDTISAPLPPMPDTPGTPVAAARPAPAPSGLIWPIHGPVAQEFGHNGHPGIDIDAPYGTPIHAAGNGVVVSAGWDGGYGNFVLIDHGNGLVTGYGHQSRIAVTRGQTVTQGDVIGYEGSTGYSTGPHVHFEVRINNAPHNPRLYIPGNP
jgi:murein DD-endopeptidase MepM/ murein hydrolase activator NlpD